MDRKIEADQVPRPVLSALRYAMLTALLVGSLASGFYFANRSGSDPLTYGNDFNVYYFASGEVIEGRDPYARRLGVWVPYLYPPLLAEAMIPLAMLPLPIAAYVWFLISVASLLVAGSMSAHLCRRAEDFKINSVGKFESHGGDAAAELPPLMLGAGAVMVVLRFALSNFELGQVNNIVVAFGIAHVYLCWRRKAFWSALALAVATSIKLTPALLIIYHLSRGRVRFALGCASLTAILIAASFLPFGSRAPGAFVEFVNRTVRNGQGFDLSDLGNQSLRGALARLDGRPVDSDPDAQGRIARQPVELLTTIISVLLLGLAIVAARWAGSDIAAAALFFCCMVMLSPLSWKTHFVALILPAAYLIQVARREVRSPLHRVVLAALLAVFVLFNLTSARVVGRVWSEWSDAQSLPFVGALIVYIMVAVSALAWRNTRISPAFKHAGKV
jgi:alpha-1,2-mannosyltransferase